MGYVVSKERMDEVLEEISWDYHVFAPAMDAQNVRVRYREITSVDEIVLDRQSDFSIKEAFYPVSQVMYYFKDGQAIPAPGPDKKGLLIIARPCDLNSIRRLDNIFLQNGGHMDMYYGRQRIRVKFILLECTQSFENCFCVSVGSNVADNYAAAIRINEEDVEIEVRDEELEEILEDEDEWDFTPEFVQENVKKIQVPDITKPMLRDISGLEFWSQFDERCIGCAGCNTVCGTCSCFDTVDVRYNEDSPEGERRRVWGGCMMPSYCETAGGNRSRKTQGANMRFKAFHKFYDYKARFGTEEHMCVGCGRCDIRCPKDISFYDSINQLHDEIEALKARKAEEAGKEAN